MQCAPVNNDVIVNASLAIGQQVWVSVETNGTDGDFQLCIESLNPSAVLGDNCVMATGICSKDPWSLGSISGATASGIKPACFSASVKKDVWLKFAVGVTGTLEFTGTPISPAEYDWAIFDITSGCPGILAACNYNYSQPVLGATVANPFGLGGSGTGEFNAPITVTAGRTYALMLDNFTNNTAGVRIEWGGTFQMTSAASFTATPTSSCSTPLTVTFNNTTVNAATFNWDFGDGTTYSGADPGTHIYTSPGIYLVSLVTTLGGCSDAAAQTLDNTRAGATIDTTACETYTLNGTVYTSTGIYTQVFTNPAGCDSTITLHLTIRHPGDTTLHVTACQSYTLNGTSYTSTGTYTQIIPNAGGCDSTITLDLVIHTDPPTSSVIDTIACETYTLNGTNYTLSGTYTQTIPNAAGCDSTITLNLLIGHPETTIVDTTGCDEFTLNGQLYTSSGTYTQVLANAAGCDSTITLNLTMNYSSNSSSTIHAIDSYALNGTTYTQSGNYIQVLTNAAGCDSTISLHLFLSFTGLNETFAQTMRLFPDPAQQFVTIDFGQQVENISVIIHDPQGKQVIERTGISGDHLNLDLEQLQPGIYFVSVSNPDNNTSVTQRLVVQ